VGTTIGFSDSNPIVSVLLKPFSSWLPVDFQFIGPWLALCFMLQGVFGARITALFTRDRLVQFLGGGLFTLSPVLAFRVGHDTLCAQWLLLALLAIGLQPDADPRSVRRRLSWTVALVMLAAGIHPYLTVMCWTLAATCYLAAWKDHRVTFVGALAWTAAATIGAIGVFWIFGYFGNPALGSSGFGQYASDLLALCNSEGRSRLLPALRSRHPGEGFGFLGLGGLFAVAVAGVAVIWRRSGAWRRAWPFALACVLMTIYACAPILCAAGHPIATMHSAFADFAGMAAVFRASGRFIWPIHYLVLTIGIWGCVRLCGPRRNVAAALLLSTAIVLQLADTNVGEISFAPRAERQLFQSGWPLAAGHYQHLALVPMDVPGACTTSWPGGDVMLYAIEAYRLKLTFNSGSFARPAVDRLQAACGALKRTTDAGILETDTIYVLVDHTPDGMRAAGVVCGHHLEGHWVCVSKDSDTEFRRYLETHR
jgi:hypothetical protein